jgi:hypothetical protein
MLVQGTINTGDGNSLSFFSNAFFIPDISIPHREHLLSAFHPIATEQRTQFYVGFVPGAVISSAWRQAELKISNIFG